MEDISIMLAFVVTGIEKKLRNRYLAVVANLRCGSRRCKRRRCMVMMSGESEYIAKRQVKRYIEVMRETVSIVRTMLSFSFVIQFCSASIRAHMELSS